MTAPLKVLSLFAGIGGFDLGLERTGGFKTVAFCEFDKKAQAVLRKHWPEVPIYDDVRTLTGAQLAADGIAPNVIVGGFPCQDISTAGAGAGIEGKRSGLWADYARLIGELQPHFVIVENVSALLGRGIDRVLGDLAALRYDAVWHCIPASHVGAPHRRDRVWVVAYPEGDRRSHRGAGDQGCNDNPQSTESIRAELGGNCPSNGTTALANTERGPGEAQHEECLLAQSRREGSPVRLADGYVSADRQWVSEPAVGRVADGVPGRVDRLKQLGNAVVPQIPELIGNAILAAERAMKEAA
jgi:DNA (cytosine-5)-methyltransferase 1